MTSRLGSAVLLIAATAHADPDWAFSGGVGRVWPQFVPSGGYKTLDAGIGGFLAVGGPVYSLPQYSLSVELAGRLASEYMSGQQFAGATSDTYGYLSFGGLAEGRLVYSQRAWVSLAGGYHHARIHNSTLASMATTDGDDSYILCAEVGGDIYAGLGLYVNTVYLGAGGATIGAGISFRIVPGP